jgi:hypothetical protein
LCVCKMCPYHFMLLFVNLSSVVFIFEFSQFFNLLFFTTYRYSFCTS